jgi:predicted nucleotidyltransferase
MVRGRGGVKRATDFGDVKSVAVKKLFYALRSAAALRWLRRHGEAAMPPMHVPTLMAECDPPRDLAALTGELIARKAVMRELGEGPPPEVIARFVAEEFEEARGG